MPTVYMVQIFAYKWQIQNEKGLVLCDDIQVPKHQAEDYVRAWVSSFHCWNYVMKPLEAKNG